jgi:polyhydroxyalkanoate synthesis regulator phasin
MDTYSLLKYKSTVLDIINLVHPNLSNSKAVVDYEGKKVSAFEAIMKGYNVSADTWEVAQSEAGQIVAQAVKEGKLSDTEAKKVLTEAKSENWKGLLTENKLGILASIRNIRNILLNKPESSTIDKLCDLISNGQEILKGKIMPYQLDMANEVLISEFNDSNARKISKALLTGYEKALPNLTELLTGNNLVMIDMSGSMGTSIMDPNRKTRYNSSCMDKASLIGMTIAKATNADVIRFGSSAEYVNYNTNSDVFSLAKTVQRNMGGTSLSEAWRVAERSGRRYDRVFILSDNECNMGSTYSRYTSYVEKVGDPYVYSIDLASYGTMAIAGPKVRYYYGYGYGMFDDIAKSEFNPTYHLEKIRKVEI